MLLFVMLQDAPEVQTNYVIQKFVIQIILLFCLW